MNVDIEKMMRQVNADDSEKPVLEECLQNAKATVAVDINRPLSDLNENEKSIFDQAVLEMATQFYLERAGNGKGVTKSYSGLNSLIESIRKVPLGGTIY